MYLKIKVYVLSKTSVSELNDSMTFVSREQAYNEMEREYNDKIEEYEWYSEDESGLFDDSATLVTNDGAEEWKISECELRINNLQEFATVFKQQLSEYSDEFAQFINKVPRVLDAAAALSAYTLELRKLLSAATPDIPGSFRNRVMALCMVELEDGLDEKQIRRLMEALPDNKKYMQIEFHENNTSAYGYIEADYYQRHDYNPEYFAKQINAILDDKTLENPNGLYMTPDERQFYMAYFND